MLMRNERIEIVEYGKKLINSGLTKGTGGNLSIYNEEKGLMAISPSGIDYFETRAEDVIIMDLKGNIVDGDKKPSSEYAMHKIFYENRDDIKAIIHTHTMFATTIACMRLTLPAVHYMIAVAGKDVRCAEYATYGTDQLAENAFKAMEGRYATLLANHGLLAGSHNLANAFNITEEVEYVSEIWWRTMVANKYCILPDEEMEIMLEKFKNYGQVK